MKKKYVIPAIRPISFQGIIPTVAAVAGVSALMAAASVAVSKMVGDDDDKQKQDEKLFAVQN